MNELNELGRKVRDLNIRVQILDENSETTEAKCIHLGNYLEETKERLIKRREVLEKNKQILQDQKNLLNEMRCLHARITYVKANYPRGIVQIFDEDSSVLSNFGKVSPIVNETFDDNLRTPQRRLTPSPTADAHLLTVPTPKPKRDVQIAVSYVTNLEFQETPTYMKGRLKATDANMFIDLFNKTLSKKYELLKKPKNSIKVKSELDKFITWKGQINADTKDLYFCTADDFSTECGVRLGKKELSLITVLRHLKRIKEIRKGKVIYYVACF